MAVATDVKVPFKLITCHVPAHIVEALDDEARVSCGPRSAVIRRALTEWAEKRRQASA